jgi:glycosyltransferase involved in cell wall biosynthesis
MHILIIHQAFASLSEPGGTRHHEFARELAANGHRVTIIASPVSYLTGKSSAGESRWKATELDGDRITIIKAYTYSAFHKSFIHRVLSFFSFMISSFLIGLGIDQVDLVWGTSPPIFQGVTAWLLARIKGARFLFEVRDLWPAFAIAVGVLKNRLLISMSEWLERFLYHRADVVMVNSPGFLNHVKDRGARIVELIPNGADPNMFSQVDGSSFRTLHQLERYFVVMYTGAHGMSNDLDVVLSAAARLKAHPGIRIVLVGDGKEKVGLQTRANLEGLTNILFLPSVGKQEIPNVIAASDACIAILKPLDLYKTTYPNKVFDTMAAGKPVLLVIDGVIRQVVEGAQAGIYCAPGDPDALAEAILLLERDRMAARRMGENGRTYLKEHFSRAKIAQDLQQLLVRMTDKNG